MKHPTGTGSVDLLLSRVRIVLSRTSHPGNIGAVARAMKTMGLSHLVLVNPRRFPDDEAIARAAGAGDVLASARVCPSLDDALANTVFACAVSARERRLGPPAIDARAAASEIVEMGEAGDVALLFGNETSGLSNVEVQRCAKMAFIPANPGYSSLNLASAVQLLCYELRLAAFAGNPPRPARAVPFASPRASHLEVEGFHAHLERVMIGSGFLDPQRSGQLLAKLRRLFARTGLERDEVNILRGLFDAVERRAATPWAGAERVFQGLVDSQAER